MTFREFVGTLDRPNRTGKTSRSSEEMTSCECCRRGVGRRFGRVRQGPALALGRGAGPAPKRTINFRNCIQPRRGLWLFFLRSPFDRVFDTFRSRVERKTDPGPRVETIDSAVFWGSDAAGRWDVRARDGDCDPSFAIRSLRRDSGTFPVADSDFEEFQRLARVSWLSSNTLHRHKALTPVSTSLKHERNSTRWLTLETARLCGLPKHPLDRV